MVSNQKNINPHTKRELVILVYLLKTSYSYYGVGVKVDQKELWLGIKKI